MSPSFPRLPPPGAALILLLAMAPGAAAQEPPPPPLLDIPDSLRAAPETEVIDGKVRAGVTRIERKELTLQEILERCTQGERGKLAGHEDMSSTTTVRVVAYWDDKKVLNEQVYRDWTNRAGENRELQLAERELEFELVDGEWRPKPPEEDGKDREGGVQLSTDGFSDFTELPFFLEQPGEFDFELVERFLRGDHVIFRIAFRPKSSFKPLPSGTVYVDTTTYRIIHEEYHFEQNPFPLFLKEISQVSRYWEELPTGEWVFTRLVMDAKLRSGLTFGLAPERLAVVLTRSDFAFDTGYDERLFGARP